MTTGTQQAERQKPTPEYYAGGKIRRIKDAHPDGSPAQPPEKRVCYICGEGGGAFNAVRDIEDVLRIVHRAQNVGDPSAMYTECQQGFEATRRQAAFRQVEEHKERLALAAYRAEGGDPARLAQRGYDCTLGDCSRYFDNQDDRDEHQKVHKLEKMAPTFAGGKETE